MVTVGNQAFMVGLNDALKREGLTEITPETYYSFQTVEELEEFPVLLIPGIGVSGEGTENGPNHQSVGQGSQQQIDQGSVEKGGDQAGHEAGAQDRHIQSVGAVASCHEPAEPGSQLGHKLSKHRENSLCENFFSILYCKTAGFQQ